VGLLGVLFTHFRAVFCLQPVYILYTLFLDGYRIVSAFRYLYKSRCLPSWKGLSTATASGAPLTENPGICR
jgi:hypothetical protein